MDTGMQKWAIDEIERAYPDADDPMRRLLMSLMALVVAHPDVDTATLVEKFSALVSGKSITDSADTSVSDRVWAPGKQYMQQGSTARVRTDYVSTPDGWKLNGRIGVVVGLRRGDAIVEFNSHVDGAPDSLRATPDVFEVDIAHLMRN